jgi:hypothetical protein
MYVYVLDDHLHAIYKALLDSRNSLWVSFEKCNKLTPSLAICSELPASLISMSHCILERQKSKEGAPSECHSSFLRLWW